MRQFTPSQRRTKRPPKPLNSAKIEELALAYVARFATSAGKLEAYLRRKLRERGVAEGEEEPDIGALVARFAARGYIDDAGYARARSGDLLRRGYGRRRIAQALHGAGIEEEIREACIPDTARLRSAALAMARKRRFGPFYAGPGEDAADRHKRREKQLAAMLRAGHDFEIARTVIDAGGVAQLDEWLAEAREDGNEDME